MDFTVIDFETATSKRASACEVAVSVYESNRLVVTKDWLIQPPQNKYDYWNTSIHGIDSSRTEGVRQFNDVWIEVVQYIENKLVVAHNAPFDMSVIREECKMYGLKLPKFNFICSYSFSKTLLPGLPSYSLDFLCRYLELTELNHHSAADDTMMTGDLFVELLRIAQVDDLDQLQENLGLIAGTMSGDNYQPFRKKLVSKKSVDAFIKDYIPDESTFDAENPFFGKKVVFTGKMNLPRVEMFKLVADVGGKPSDNLNKSSDYLVVGQQDYRIVGDDGMSGKQEKAVKLISEGCNLIILSESEFFQMLPNSME